MSVQLQILDELVARLQAIRVDGGFATDAGERVYLGRRDFGDGDTFPLLTVLDGQEDVEAMLGRRYRCTLAVAIEGHTYDETEPTVAGYTLKSDVHRAIELDDITLGGVALGMQYDGADEPEFAEDGGPGGVFRLRYLVQYDRDHGA